MLRLNKNVKQFHINDYDKSILIKQPTFEELTSLYYVLLNNLNKINKSYLSEVNTLENFIIK